MGRIAVGIYGHVNEWEVCRDSFINKVLSHTSHSHIDVFVHVYNRKYYHGDGASETYSDSQIRDMFAPIKPRKLVVEDDTAPMYIQQRMEEAQNVIRISPGRNLQSAYKGVCFFRKLRITYDLIGDPNDYDIIMITRPDLEYLTNLTLTPEKWPEPGRMHIASCKLISGPVAPFPDPGLMISSLEPIREYCHIYPTFNIISLEGSVALANIARNRGMSPWDMCQHRVDVLKHT